MRKRWSCSCAWASNIHALLACVVRFLLQLLFAHYCRRGGDFGDVALATNARDLGRSNKLLLKLAGEAMESRWSNLVVGCAREPEGSPQLELRASPIPPAASTQLLLSIQRSYSRGPRLEASAFIHSPLLSCSHTTPHIQHCAENVSARPNSQPHPAKHEATPQKFWAKTQCWSSLHTLLHLQPTDS